MNREILFRGKRINSMKAGEWAEGFFMEWLNPCKNRKEARIQTISEGGCIDLIHEVNPSTVGQYTGLKDKNGKRIFEGDIVRVADDEDDTQFSDGGIGRVAFDYGLWYVHGTVSNSLYDVSNVYHIEVIGNIHDNPELLEVR